MVDWFENSNFHNTNKYKNMVLIGQGGMGAVYKATDNLNRCVAIKQIRLNIKTYKSLERFIREAETLAALNHPNIPTVYSLDDVYDKDLKRNVPHQLVMEYINGKNLGEFIFKKERKIKVDRCVEVIETLSQILKYVHKKRIVHRDVKPQNIILDNTGRIFLVDFGLAKDIAKTEEFTMPGEILGTYGYLSPEQAKKESVTYKSDIYSLGIVFYEYITGNKFMRVEDYFSKSQFLNAIVNRPHIKNSDFKEHIPKRLIKLCQNMLDKNPNCRPSAQEIETYLKNLQSKNNKTKQIKEKNRPQQSKNNEQKDKLKRLSLSITEKGIRKKLSQAEAKIGNIFKLETCKELYKLALSTFKNRKVQDAANIWVVVYAATKNSKVISSEQKSNIMAECLNALAVTEQTLKHYTKSRELYVEATKLASKGSIKSSTYFNLAALCSLKGELEGALRYLDLALKYAPANHLKKSWIQFLSEPSTFQLQIRARDELVQRVQKTLQNDSIKEIIELFRR